MLNLLKPLPPPPPPSPLHLPPPPSPRPSLLIPPRSFSSSDLPPTTSPPHRLCPDPPQIWLDPFQPPTSSQIPSPSHLRSHPKSCPRSEISPRSRPDPIFPLDLPRSLSRPPNLLCRSLADLPPRWRPWKPSKWQILNFWPSQALN